MKFEEGSSINSTEGFIERQSFEAVSLKKEEKECEISLQEKDLLFQKISQEANSLITELLKIQIKEDLTIEDLRQIDFLSGQILLKNKELKRINEEIKVLNDKMYLLKNKMIVIRDNLDILDHEKIGKGMLDSKKD